MLLQAPSYDPAGSVAKEQTLGQQLGHLLPAVRAMQEFLDLLFLSIR